jgi:hypothetical protein
MLDIATDVRKGLSWWKWWLFRQKYRFDLGQQFLSILNFTLLIITASDKLRYYTNIPRTWVLVALAVPTGFTGMWLFGYFLDQVVKYAQAYNIEASKRNPIWDEQKEMMVRLERSLERLEQKLK